MKGRLFLFYDFNTLILCNPSNPDGKGAMNKQEEEEKFCIIGILHLV